MIPDLYAEILALLKEQPGLPSAEIAAGVGGPWSSYHIHDVLLEYEKNGVVCWKQDGPGTAWLWELT